LKKISILTTNARIPSFFIYPIKKNKALLHETGYDINFIYKPKNKKLSCDILSLMSIYFTKWWHTPERVIEFIEEAKKYCNKIVWLDDNDSTGVTHFELLPYIDLYLKKQLLKDKKQYAKALYGDRLFTDYYHKEFGIVDETTYQSKPLDMSLAHKVQLSWHIGLGDMAGDILPRWVRFIRSRMRPQYPKALQDVNGLRSFDFMFKGTRKYPRNTVSFHREEIGKKIDDMTHLKSVLQGRVSIPEYKRQMSQSKIVISPFGWGEIGVRDFETWIYGAALMKPDMSHMETWPDVFIPFETYYPINWNFDNLETGVKQLLDDDRLRLRLAEKGQNAYARMTSEEGMEDFCNWFVQQIER